MEIPWPINTTFRIYIQEGEEIWTVSNKSDPRNSIVNSETPLGRALILSGGNRICSYYTPGNELVIFMILGVKLPTADWDIFENPIDYYLHIYSMDCSGIRTYHFMADICLNCGHQNPPATQGVRTCEVCRTSWLSSHCWNCGSPVDSRDPGTPLCSRRCGGCICANCRSCFCDANFLWTQKERDEE